MNPPLIVALHGVGSSADDMIAALHPLDAFADVIALPGHEPFDSSDIGRQWFSVMGVTVGNRSTRTAAALPALIAKLDQLAVARNIRRDDIILLGFSQGAIMTLAAVAGGYHCGRAISIAGRLAVPVSPALDRQAEILVVHDADDQIMPSGLSLEAAAALNHAGHAAKILETAGVGHRIGAATLEAISTWLTRHHQSAYSPIALEG
jgi:phospholipase/carboxylesterase